MKKYLIAAVLLVCGIPLYAQGPRASGKAAAPAAVAQSTQTARGVQPAADKKKSAAKPAADKQADQESEDSVVMIDSKGGDAEDNGSFSAGEDREEKAVPGGLPASYGQCKGTITEGGRSLLVFESPDDGTVSFVQVSVGKNNVTWKLAGRIPRSAD
jgi:hypothetical protein